MRSLFFRRSVARAKQAPSLREAARFLRNATLAPSYAEIRALVNNPSGLEATLSANTNTVVLTVGSTNDLYTGQLLKKTSGTGEFNVDCFVVLISDADTTTFTVSNSHLASGAIVFSGANDFTTNHFARWIDAQIALSPPMITATQPARVWNFDVGNNYPQKFATLVSGSTDVTLTTGNTSGMLVGDVLGYNLAQGYGDTGRFGVGSQVDTIIDSTRFTTTVPHAASGRIWMLFHSGIQQTIRMRETVLNMAYNQGGIGRNRPWSQYQGGKTYSEAYRFYLHPDKLRARVTRALAELYSVGSGILDGYNAAGGSDFTDMLSASAFGNYEDLIYSVTKSPIMGRWLTYVNNSKASATSEPDENYAREILQLYTIGLWELKLDGSRKLARDLSPNDRRYIAYPNTGWDSEVPTYDYDDIRAMARILTGYVNGGGGNQDTQPQFNFLGNVDSTITVTMVNTATSHGLVPGDGVFLNFPYYSSCPWRVSMAKGSTSCTVVNTLGFGTIEGLQVGSVFKRRYSNDASRIITSIDTGTNTFTADTTSTLSTDTYDIELLPLYHRPLSAVFSVMSTSSDTVFTVDYATFPTLVATTSTSVVGRGGSGYISSSPAVYGGVNQGMAMNTAAHEYSLPKIALKWITGDPDKIEGAAALDGVVYIPSRSISLNATLVANTNTVTLTGGSTGELYVGQPLSKISGTGVFGTDTTVASIKDFDEFTVSINHKTAGAVVFKGTATGFQATLEQDSNTVVLTPGKGVTQGLYVGQAVSKLSGVGDFGTGTIITSIEIGSTSTFTVSIPHQTSGVISFQGLAERTMVGVSTTAAQALAEQEVRWAMRALAHHPSTAPYFVTRMIRMMITSNPSPGYIARVASVFRNDGNGVVGNLAAVFKAMLLDQEARAPASKNLIARSTDPHDLGATLVGAARRRMDSGGSRLEGAGNASSYNPANIYGSPFRDPGYLNPGIGYGMWTTGSVFGRYPTTFTPAGPVQDAGKRAPELYLYDENGTTAIYNTTDNYNITAEYITQRETEYLLLATSNPNALANIDALIEKYNILFTGGTATPAYIAALSSFIKNPVNFSRNTVASQQAALTLIIHSLYISPYSVIRT
jgi:uncharacterized protein (DUF1800 family)